MAVPLDTTGAPVVAGTQYALTVFARINDNTNTLTAVDVGRETLQIPSERLVPMGELGGGGGGGLTHPQIMARVRFGRVF